MNFGGPRTGISASMTILGVELIGVVSDLFLGLWRLASAKGDAGPNFSVSGRPVLV